MFRAKANDLQRADISVAACFSGVELVLAIILAVVANRIPYGAHPRRWTLSEACVFVSAFISLCSAIASFTLEEFPLAIVFIAQWISDTCAFVLTKRATSNNLVPGSGSIWRVVGSTTMTILAIPFVAPELVSRVLLGIVALCRATFIFILVVGGRIRENRPETVLDEGRILFNYDPARSNRLLEDHQQDDESNDAGNTHAGMLRTNLGENLLFNEDSLVIGLNVPNTRNTSASTSDSADSFPYMTSSRGGSADDPYLRVVHHESSEQADDAGGLIVEDLWGKLPEWVRVIGYREVLTTGSVPLVVYILQTDENGVVVRRYGEFRSLCNRLMSNFYHEFGAEAPTFPGRRVFRKFIPRAIGGTAHTDATERDFIANRANGLGQWTQQVLGLVKSHPQNGKVVRAMAEFLKPVIQFSPDSDLEQVMNSAVSIFSDTVLNPIAVPSPYL